MTTESKSFEPLGRKNLVPTRASLDTLAFGYLDPGTNMCFIFPTRRAKVGQLEPRPVSTP